MRAGWLGVVVLLGAVLVGECHPGGPGHRSDSAPSASASRTRPKYTRLPEPPRQHSAWKPPPTDLPEGLVSATRALFDEGLPDPRGLDYRAIRITVGYVWGGRSAVLQTHGWVLPDRRFAVAWNGLVYPAVSVGAPADLGKDVRNAIAAHRARKAKEEKGIFDFPGGNDEAASVSLHAVLPLRVAILLRLGKPKLAGRVWTEWMVRSAPDPGNLGPPGHDPDRPDPYLQLADDWMWAGFDRAVCAHMRGDDALSLASAVAVSRARGAVEAEAERRGFRHQWDYRFDSKKPRMETLPYLPYLRHLPELIADERRRVMEPRLPRPTPASLAKLPESARIAALIRDLENVQAYQWSQPGGVSTRCDPTVQALVGEGAPAVEPLLHVLETDQRLTRSVEFPRDFMHVRTLIPVGEAAYDALSGIVGMAFSDPDSWTDPAALDLAGRRRIAARIRAYWDKAGGLSRAERWYRVLADDHETPDHWLQVATQIAQPPGGDDITTPPTFLEPAWMGLPAPRPPPNPGKPAGEALRGKKRPSVVELMSRRIRDLAPNTYQACQMALVLAHWDGTGALPALRELDARLMKRRDKKSGDCVADLTIERAGAGDTAALLQYAVWLRGVTRLEADDRPEVLTPLWTYPRAPELHAAADRVFDEKDSPWVPMDGSHESEDELGWMPLVRIPAFRAHALRMLSDRHVIGFVIVKKGRTVSIQYKGRGGPSFGVQSSAALPKTGTMRTLRMCDQYARLISSYDKGPPFEVYWDRRKRDSALESVRRFLRAYK